MMLFAKMAAMLKGRATPRLPISYTANGNASVAAANPATVASVPFGVADPTRLVVAIIFWANSSARTVSSATINGAPATIIQQTSSSEIGVAMISVDLGALGNNATSGSVVVTFSGAVTGSVVVECYSIYNAGSNTPAKSNAGNTTTTTTNLAINLGSSSPGDGVVIGGVAAKTSAAGITTTWDDPTPLATPYVEDFDSNTAIASSTVATSASALMDANGAEQAIRATLSASQTAGRLRMVAALWQ